ASSNAATVSSQYALPSPVVELCQNVIETEPSSEPESPPPPQAVSTRVLAIATADTARSFRDFIVPSSSSSRRGARCWSAPGRLRVGAAENDSGSRGGVVSIDIDNVLQTMAATPRRGRASPPPGATVSPCAPREE